MLIRTRRHQLAGAPQNCQSEYNGNANSSTGVRIYLYMVYSLSIIPISSVLFESSFFGYILLRLAKYLKKGLSFAESDFYYCGYFLHRQDHDSLVEWIAVIITPHNSDYCLASTVDYILLLERALIFFNGIYSKPFKWLILDLKIHWPKHVLYVQQALSLIKIYMIQNFSAFSINLSTCNKCLSVALLSDVALIDKTCAWYFQNIILLILYKMILIKR